MASPLNSDGNLVLVAGDDYKNADGRAATFTDATWPSVTGATVVLHIGSVTSTGTVVSSSSVRFDLTKAQTAAITAGAFTVVATLSNGDVVTLDTGAVILK